MIGNLTGAVLLDRKGSITTLFIVFIALALCSVFALLFLRKISDEDLQGLDSETPGPLLDESPAQPGTAVSKSSKPAAHASSTGRRVTLRDIVSLHSNYLMYLMIPLIVYNGLSVAFASGDFTKQAVKVNLMDPGDPESGTHWIGYVMAVCSASNTLASITVGKLSDRIGKAPMIVVGVLCQLAFLIICFVYDFADGHKKFGILFTAAGLFGIGDAVWNVIINSMLGAYHSQMPDTAFASFKAWQSIATASAFFYG